MSIQDREKVVRELLAGVTEDHLRMSTKTAMDDHHSQFRWPFELLQNAHDAGPRKGTDTISVSYSYCATSEEFTFTHDGRPFTTKEAFTVITGYSSKASEALDNRQNTQVGRYGTGFLTTHTISGKVEVSGELEDDGETAKPFRFEIDRCVVAGETLRPGLSVTLDQLLDSQQGPGGTGSSARFVYKSASVECVRSGISRLVGSLPVLFSTCEKLGSVTVDIDGAKEVWQRMGTEIESFKDCNVETTTIERKAREHTELKVLKFSIKERKVPARQGCAILALQGKQLLPPVNKYDWRGLYRKFPLIGNTQISLPVAIDGAFEVVKSRDNLLGGGKDPGTLSREVEETRGAANDAIKAMAYAIQYLIAERLPNAAESALLQKAEGNDFGWWDELLAETCCDLLTAPVAWTTDEKLERFVSGSDDDPTLVYVPRAVLEDEAKYDTDKRPEKAKAYEDGLRDFYRLLKLDGRFSTVSFDDALAWRRNFKSWAGLTPSESLTKRLQKLQLSVAQVAAMKADTVEGDSFLDDTNDALPAGQNRHDRLILLWQLVGFCWRMGRGAHDLSPLKGFVPCQNGVDTNPTEDKPDDLKVDEDADIPLELKDAADSLEVECRARLLDPMFRRAAELVDEEGKSRFPDLGKVIGAVTGRRKRGAKDVVKACTEALSLRFNQLQGKPPVEQMKFYSASERFALTLWHLDQAEYQAGIAGLKWLSSDGRSAVEKGALLPVASWPDNTKAYACVFPEKRMLHERYTDPNTLAMLESCIGLTRDLKDGKKVRFWPEVQGTLSEDRVLHTDPVKKVERMKRLTVFVNFHVNYLAEVSPRDEITLHSDGWAKDFASLAFIHSDQAGKIVSEKATADTLTKADLNNPDWFSTANRRTFLVECLKFKQLDVSTRCLTKGDGEALQRVEGVLAEICDKAFLLGDDYLDQLRGLVEATVTQTTRARRLEVLVQVGHSIEAIVRDVLSNEFGAGAVERAHVGHDIRVILSDDAILVGSPSDGAAEYVEVKSTKSNFVRMTRAQADLAVRNSDNYTLCVVDAEDLEVLLGPDGESESDRRTRLERLIRERARFVNNIGHLVSDADQLIEEIAGQREESVSVESHDLKVRVKSEVWEDESLDFDGWIGYLRGKRASGQVRTDPLGGE